MIANLKRWGQSWLNLLRALKVTGAHFVQPKITIQYPDEQTPHSPHLRGPLFLVKKNEQLRCIGCKLCAMVCPAKAITLITHKENNTLHVVSYEIDEGKCIFCGNCVRICPKDAIQMSSQNPRVTQNVSLLLRNQDQLSANLETKVSPESSI